jgi:sec-independent protein translocase protein TatC
MLIVAFVFGALFTPGPDVFSQCALAIPFVILYEVGIVGARLFGKRKESHEPLIAENSR